MRVLLVPLVIALVFSCNPDRPRPSDPGPGEEIDPPAESMSRAIAHSVLEALPVPMFSQEEELEAVWVAPRDGEVLVVVEWLVPLGSDAWTHQVGAPKPPIEEEYFTSGPGSTEPEPITWREDLEHGHSIERAWVRADRRFLGQLAPLLRGDDR